MALQHIDLPNTPYGGTIAIAYIKILKFAGNKDKVDFSLAVYNSETDRLNDKKPLWVDSFTLPYTDNMSLSALYDYIKTLPVYVGSTDVI